MTNVTSTPTIDLLSPVFLDLISTKAGKRIEAKFKYSKNVKK
jgi:hypothetical protein